MFLANFLIALREGVEASLVVGLLIAYLVKFNRKDRLPALWLGVAVGALVPLGLGAYMTWGPYTLEFWAQEVLGGVLSLVAAAFITWMIFWMANNAKALSAGLEEKTQTALSSHKASAIAWLALLTVGREGIETALLVWSTVRSAAQTNVIMPAIGMICGLVVAIVIGWLFYAGATRINLRSFFKVTSFFLVLVAAGICLYGIGDLQEAGVLPGHGIALFDLSGYFDTPAHPWLRTDAWYFVLLTAMFNVELAPTLLQVLGYVLYLLVVFPIFWRVYGSKKSNAPVKEYTDQNLNLGSAAV